MIHPMLSLASHDPTSDQASQTASNMFGTLHLSSRGKETEFVKQPNATSFRERTTACDKCRTHKVKCHTDGSGCRRCSKLRKKCTFTSAKQSPGARKEKGKMPLTPHERQLDFTVETQTMGTQKEASPDYTSEPLPSPPTGASSEADASSGNELFSELLLHGESDFFDVSTLLDVDETYFEHQAQPEEFSNFPSSDARSSPSTSLGSDQTQYIPIQETVIPGIGIESKLDHSIPSVPSSSVSQYFVSSCRCLATAALAVEQFETSSNQGNRADLDAIIGYLKKAVRCCRLMIICDSCTQERENLVMLVFIIEKVVGACSQIIEIYSAEGSPVESNLHSMASSATESTLLQDGDLQFNLWDLDFLDTSSRARIMSTSPTNTGTSSWRELLVGDYEVSSQPEWEHLMGALISMQLRAVTDLLASTKQLKCGSLTKAQEGSLMKSQQCIMELASRMGTLG